MRHKTVRGVDYIIAIGGAAGTTEEIDLAAYSGTTIIPFPASGDSARRIYELAQEGDARLRRCVPDRCFDALATCQHAEQFVEIVKHIIEDRQGVVS